MVVTAGAGAGKTLTLVARYLALLAEGRPLRGAIAITFTEKAAREMRNRVRDEVRRYLERTVLRRAQDKPCRTLSVTDGKRSTAGWMRRASAPSTACAPRSCAATPPRPAVEPRFDVLDEGQGNLLRRQAVDETLAWAAEEPELVPLFELLGERGFRNARYPAPAPTGSG